MQYRRFLFWAILSFAAVVRLKGLSAGLPLHTLYGEGDTLQILQQILHTGDLNPHQFLYPGLAYYIYLPALYLFYGIGAATGYFAGTQTVPDVSLVFIGRFVTALLGTASVYLIYRVGKHFSEAIAFLGMAILAGVPQHVEFSHMLRPEIPAVFFLLLALYFALNMIARPPQQRNFLLFGLAAGASFSTKYEIGLPLLICLATAWWLNRREIRWAWPIESLLCFAGTFAVLNPFLITDPPAILHWMRQVDLFYVPSEVYYQKSVISYYIEYLIRYNYNLPLILAAAIGIVLTVVRYPKQGVLAAVYPVCALIWLSTFENRRIHGLLALHPFLALWAAASLAALWQLTRRISLAGFFRFAYTLLLFAMLLFPYYRSCVQSYLFSRQDNRSKAELWMTNRLPKGSRIALLQYHQMELDPEYFQIQDFSPREYIGKKNFHWFAQQGFDYVVLSSGQYMRYFVEGTAAKAYGDYFLQFFSDASEQGTLVLDLITHPTLIPDYRIKIFSTHRLPAPPDFFPAVGTLKSKTSYLLTGPGSLLDLPPGYYKLKIAQNGPFSIQVKNLKFNEIILQTNTNAVLSAAETADNFPFAIFPAPLSSHLALFTLPHPKISPNQIVRFRWTGIPRGIHIQQLEPDIAIQHVDFSFTRDPVLPYLLLSKNQPFSLSCTLLNRSPATISGYVEAFLSEIGEPQPWKNFEAASQTQEFFLESGQEIKIDVPFDTGDLTGDQQLSFWVFTRHDLPFSPQNGGWFSAQIRVDDPRLGIHPIYGVPIP